jgi:hypothetical protein
MSADRYTTIHHLTKTGWKKGVEGCYLPAKKEEEELPPAERLLTLRYEEFTAYRDTDYTYSVKYITSRYEDLLHAVVKYGAYPPRELASAERYEQDSSLMRLFPGKIEAQPQTT